VGVIALHGQDKTGDKMKNEKQQKQKEEEEKVAEELFKNVRLQFW
jgi:hypothetical protein